MVKLQPCLLQNKATSEKNRSIHPKNTRQSNGHPHAAVVPENQEGAGQRHEDHKDGNHADGDSRGESPRRRRLSAAASSVIVITAVAPIRWPSSAATHAAILDDEFNVRRCN